MKVSTIRNLRGLLTSKQVTFTGDQLVNLVEIIQELQIEEKRAIDRESAPAVQLGAVDVPEVVSSEPDAGYEEYKRNASRG